MFQYHHGWLLWTYFLLRCDNLMKIFHGTCLARSHNVLSVPNWCSWMDVATLGILLLFLFNLFLNGVLGICAINGPILDKPVKPILIFITTWPHLNVAYDLIRYHHSTHACWCGYDILSTRIIVIPQAADSQTWNCVAKSLCFLTSDAINRYNKFVPWLNIWIYFKC